MKFPTLKGEKTAYFPVGALHGGCNLRDGNRAADGQLAAVNNLWWHNGALRTRPAFSVREDLKQPLERVEVTWKFCNEDTVKGQAVGRRFLRRERNLDTNKVLFKTGVLTYDGRFLYEGTLQEQDAEITGMVMEYPYTADENVLLFLSDGRVYAQNLDGELRSVSEEAYVPCVLVGGEGVRRLSDTPPNVGVRYEGRNLLTDEFSAQYTTTGTGAVFHLPYSDLDNSKPVTISIVFQDVGLVEYVIPPNASKPQYGANGFVPYVNRYRGIISFLDEVNTLTPLPEGVPNNMTVTAYKARTEEEKGLIASMSFCTWLGGSRAGHDSRHFFSGSAKMKNRIYWSGQGQPLYFPETNYISVGDINQSITALGKQDGLLVVFKEREIYSLSSPQGTVSGDKVDGQLVQAATATSEYFPLTQLNGHIGCTAPHTVVPCGIRLCWADGTGGVYTLISDTSGHKVKELSALIAPQLKVHGEEAWKQANGALYEGHYLLQVDSRIYALRVDEKAFRQYANVYSDSKAQQSLAWYLWTLPNGYAIDFLYGSGSAVSALVHRTDEDGQTVYEMPLYLHDGGDGDHSYDFEDWEHIPVSFSTKEYDFGMPFARKRMLRVYIGLATSKAADIGFLYLRDGVRCVATHGVTGERTGELMLTPNLSRVQRGGFILQGVGKIAVDSLAFTYR